MRTESKASPSIGADPDSTTARNWTNVEPSISIDGARFDEPTIGASSPTGAVRHPARRTPNEDSDLEKAR